MRRIFNAWYCFVFVTSISLFASPGFAQRPLESLDVWLGRQAQIAESRMYMNISPMGAMRGVILASPSTQDPNYYYYWVRDGALVMRSILALYESTTGQEKARHQMTLLEYVRFSRDNQLRTGMAAMGEPRFNVDGSINTEPWGRPQNDGPALRALTMIRFAHNLLAEGQRAYVETELYAGRMPADTVIKADLEYVAHNWRSKCIDLWEEIWGQHFFTRAVQLTALREGAKLAQLLGDMGAAHFYWSEANQLELELQKHWSPERGYYLATVDSNAGPDHQKPMELDTAVLLAALSSEQSTGPLAITDGHILATATKLEETFANLYGINQNKNFGTAIGRYAEDYYFGGNPWVLTTAAFAELHYKLAVILDHARTFPLNESQAYFFNHLLQNRVRIVVQQGTDLAASPILKAKVIEALYDKGDSFMERIRLHTNPDGSLSEQIDRNTGFMISARDLTWSYSSFLRATFARQSARAF